MKETLNIVKVGGKVINDPKSLDTFLQDFVNIKGPKVLVHGGGTAATDLSEKLGIDTQMIEGRRITSTENLDVVTMVYAGLINKTICAKLQALHCNAIGLSGADANTILSTKRKPNPIDFGWVGDIKSVQNNAIQLFLDNGLTPIFSAIGHDGNGQLLNTNADTIAAEIAIAMSKKFNVSLHYSFEKKGVLKNINDEESVITSISENSYQTLTSTGIIHDGMHPKLHNCFHALRGNVSKVSIGKTQIVL